MKYAVIVALLCLCTIAVTGQPNQTPAKGEQSAEPKSAPLTPAPNNNITTYYAERPDDNPPKWYAAIERPDWWLVFIALLTGSAVAYQAKEMRDSTDVMRGQLTAMQGQIGQMESSGVQTTALIAAAQKSADAARISADIVAKVSVPTLKISEFKIGPVNVSSNLAFFRRPKFEITVKNWGQTPAFLWSWTLEMTCENLPEIPVYSGIASGMPLEKQVIRGGGTFTLPEVGFPRQHDFSVDDALAVSEQQKTVQGLRVHLLRGYFRQPTSENEILRDSPECLWRS
jgi:hypothetical protein